ncbi:TonB-dependent receptor [Methylocystis echinoides]|uniref:TonB-dependent receptor n=1 Tax=Methylocystis echinoides TaxID=29468 RepID=UPI002491E788|nr:TonB-dependent receptor plug domain-containing protein [Methylocystis echinoides]
MSKARFGACVLMSAAMTTPSALAQIALPDLTIHSARRHTRAAGPVVSRAVHVDVKPEPAHAPEPPPAPAPVEQKSEVKIDEFRPAASDTVQLLQNTPGVSTYEAGGVARLPAIHGLADDRLKIVVGGLQTTSACANHMNPPMSYVDPNNVGKIEVHSGVMSVSKGGDSIGGSIIVEPKKPVFAPARIPGEPLIEAQMAANGSTSPSLIPSWAPRGKGVQIDKVLSTGLISSFFRTTNNGVGVSGTFNVATDHYALLYNGAWQRATDYHAGREGYKVLSTGFISQNNSATLAYQNDGQELSLRGSVQNIPYQAFVNQRMDMTKNRAYQIDGNYTGNFDFGKVDLHAFWQYTNHTMGFLYDKQPDSMPMATNGADIGYTASLEHKLNDTDLLRVGSEFHAFRLNDYWDAIPDICALSQCLGKRGPYLGYGGGFMWANDYTTWNGDYTRTINMGMLMMGPLTQWNINNGRRDRVGHYAEWFSQWTPEWSTEVGLRNEIVMMNVDEAIPYDPRDPAPMPMLISGSGQFGDRRNRWTVMDMWNPDAVAADKFNQRDRSRVDINFDVTAKAKYEPDPFTTYEGGYSRKTRSPNLYERYTWVVGSMSTAMVNWFGDGNGYTGNVDLKPEVAHTFGVTGSWRSPTADWEARIAPFFSYVENYINAGRYAAFRFTGMFPPGYYTFQQLQFRNSNAMLYGFDVSGRMKFFESPDWGQISGNALINYTYGVDLGIGNAKNCVGFMSMAQPTVDAILYDQACYANATGLNPQDGLYNIMPLNARFSVEHRLGGLLSALELQWVDRKSHVSTQRNELQTPGYALLNFRTSYEWENFRLDFAIENLANTFYYPALGGFYMTGYKVWTNMGGNANTYAPFGPVGPVPGPGRNIIAGLTVKF